jgi:hypothetical protein
MMAFLSLPEDMKWLRDVHLHGLPPEYESAVVHGNEDWPFQIEAYLPSDPSIHDIPVVFYPDPNGLFRVQT